MVSAYVYMCIYVSVSMVSFWNSWPSLIPRVEVVWLEVRIEVGMC